VLIALLSDASADVQRASAEALGGFGSVAAVEPLLPLAEGFGRSQLRQAARGAIGRIQSRLGNVEAGRVSLADDQELAGAVDLADTAATRVGELSLVQEAASELEVAETAIASSQTKLR
jgi:HEAT repeat protein